MGKIKENNSIKLSQSLKEWFYDYLVILIELIIVAIVFSILYLVILNGVPKFTENQSNLISFLTSVLPVIILFTYMDFHGGSYGKIKASLTLVYRKKTVGSALIRNIIKFIPWQIAHIGIISGVYSEFQSLISQVFTWSSVVLLFLLMGMRLFRKDGRHIGDILAGTQVVASISE